MTQGFTNPTIAIPISPAYGGTGINNGTSTITIGGNLTTSGAYASTFIMTNTTSVTFPTGGSLINKVTTQNFTANGTYTPTAGMVYCWVRLVGSGGAGGGAGSTGSSSSSAGGGGGAGEYAEGIFSAGTISASQAVTIGAGGTAGTTGNHPGNNGNTSSLGSLITAAGGTGGNGSAASAATSYVLGGAGGTGGTGGSIHIPGANGFAGFVTPTLSISLGGPGAGSAFGSQNPPNTISNASSTGSSGSLYGSGGSGGSCDHTGGSSNVAGGPGSAGFMIIIEFCCV